MNGSMYATNGHSSPISLPELLGPYTKDELYSMVLELAQSHESMYQIILNRVYSGEKWRKLFVHGLSPQTTKASLALTFQQFGGVKEAVVMLDQNYHSKCHGFVTFHSAQSARSALCHSVFIDGRKVQCDYAFKGNPSRPKVLVQHQPVISPEQRMAADGRRLFIHDLAWKTDNQTLREAFIQYGEIEEAVVIHDRKTGKSKGFGFVTFASAKSARDALRQPEKRIDGRTAKVQYAKATKDGEAPPAPIHASSPSPSLSVSSKASDSVESQPQLAHIRTRKTLPLFNEASGESIVSNVSCGSQSTSRGNGMMIDYSNSVFPATIPMLTSGPNSGSWNHLYHALTPGPPSQTTSVGAPVSPQMVPPMAITPPVMHPSMLLPPPSPSTLGLRSTFSQELNVQQMQTGFLVNVQGMLQSIPPIPIFVQQPQPQPLKKASTE